MPPSARKDTTPAAPSDPQVAPAEVSETPIHDQLMDDLANADPEDVTLFEEDDDPLSHVGDLAEDEPDADETEENA